MPGFCGFMRCPCGVAYARAHGRRNFNVWIDHAPTIAAVVVAAGLAAIGKGGDLRALLFAVSGLGAVAMTIAGAISRRDLAPEFVRRMREAAVIGLPMVGASLVGAWMVSSGRIYMGLFLSREDVYAYAFTFRVASLLVLLHAVVVTAFAAQLNKMPTRRFDPIGASLVGVLAIGALLLILVAPERLAIGWLSPAKAALLTARPALALVAAQVYFWVASAMVEMRVSRARGAGASMQLNIIVSLCVGAGTASLASLWTNRFWRFDGGFACPTGGRLRRAICVSRLAGRDAAQDSIRDPHRRRRCHCHGVASHLDKSVSVLSEFSGTAHFLLPTHWRAPATRAFVASRALEFVDFLMGSSTKQILRDAFSTL